MRQVGLRFLRYVCRYHIASSSCGVASVVGHAGTLHAWSVSGGCFQSLYWDNGSFVPSTVEQWRRKTGEQKTINMTKLSVDNIQLEVLDEGQGDPVLLVHGFPLDHTMWRFQVDALSTRHRVIAPDLRGFGHSDVTSGTVTMARFADDLAAVLDSLQIQSAVTYCGLSMGGYVGWEFFRRHRHRLSRMIMCDTRAVGDTQQVSRGRLLMAARVCEQGPGFIPDAMFPKLFAEETLAYQPGIVAATRSTILATSAEGIAAAQRGMAGRSDATPMLASVDVPVLLIAGAHDVISPPAEMQDIADALPVATFVSVDRSSHLSPLENPDAVNEVMLRFLEAGRE